MTQFVGHDPFQLVRGEDAQDAFGCRHGSVLGISPGGKCVRGVRGNDVHLRHGQTGPLGQTPDQGVKLRRLGFAHFLRPVHPEDHPIGPPVRGEIHQTGEQKRHHHPLLAAEHATDQDEENGHRRQQGRGLHRIRHRVNSFTLSRRKRPGARG
jgi:hypothetical protein